MAIDFPSSPFHGQVYVMPQKYGSGPCYYYHWGTKTWRRRNGAALPKNRIVNPVMQVSQEKIDTATTAGASASVYAADQWGYASAATVTAQLNVQRVIKTTPRGSKYRIKANVTTAQATVAAGDFITFLQRIEGNKLADLSWGNTAGKYAILRFGFCAPAGTYGVSLRNGAYNRVYYYNLVISSADANKDIEYSWVIPPDLTGTWATDNTIGIDLSIALMAGTTYMGSAATANTWTDGNYLATTNISNNLALVGAAFELFDVGLYVDKFITGVLPEWQQPHIEDDLQDCLRYWYPGYRWDGVSNSATNGYVWMSHYVPMRVSPARALVGATLRVFDQSTAPNITAIADYNTNADSNSLLVTAAAGGFTVGRPYRVLIDTQSAQYISVSARM